MFGLFFLFHTALGAEFLLDAKVPAAIAVDGRIVAQLYEPSKVSIPVDEGDHTVMVTVGGRPTSFDLTVAEGETHVLLAGRTGITVGQVQKTASDLDASEPVTIQLRASGPASVMVQIGSDRHVVAPREHLDITVLPGIHKMSIRSDDGMSIYARGTLELTGAENLVLTVKEGALPETSGEGMNFRPDRS